MRAASSGANPRPRPISSYPDLFHGCPVLPPLILSSAGPSPCEGRRVSKDGRRRTGSFDTRRFRLAPKAALLRMRGSGAASLGMRKRRAADDASDAPFGFARWLNRTAMGGRRPSSRRPGPARHRCRAGKPGPFAAGAAPSAGALRAGFRRRRARRFPGSRPWRLRKRSTVESPKTRPSAASAARSGADAEFRPRLQKAENPLPVRLDDRRAAAALPGGPELAALAVLPHPPGDADAGDIEKPARGPRAHALLHHRRHRPAPQLLIDRPARPPLRQTFRHRLALSAPRPCDGPNRNSLRPHARSNFVRSNSPLCDRLKEAARRCARPAGAPVLSSGRPRPPGLCACIAGC